MKFKSAPRPSPIAGTWYASDPTQLAAQIDTFIASANISDDEFNGELFGIISPHAGYRYSGKTAGYAYKTVQGISRDIIVVLSPFHQFISGDVITTSFGSYKTPLGEVSVADDLMNNIAEILAGEKINIRQIDHDQEHSLEIQLPFLQCALAGEFRLIPLMVRTREKKQLQNISNTLMSVLKDQSFLIVASTDLSHFYPLEVAQQLDAEMLRRIKGMDADAVLSAEREGVASACGASSVAALLYVAKHYPSAKSYILNYSTSADDTGDASSVVGYGSAAVYI